MTTLIIGHVIALVVLIIFPHANKVHETGKDGVRRYRQRDGKFISKKKHYFRLALFYVITGGLYLISIYKNFLA